jgi:signal peptidase I
MSRVSDPAATDPPISEPPPPPLGAVTPATAPEPKRRKRSSARNVVEWVVIIVAALLVALVIKTFLFQAFFIPSESMEPTLKPGDRVLVNKLSYDLHSIHRGDIVVFKRPPSEAGNPAIKDLIKRVIGLPGDTIEAIDGKVYINGQLHNEPYLPAGTVTTNLPRRVVPPGQYFVMGDNRSNSSDSRFIGPISGSLIVGRAFVRVWPLSSINLL